ncbi:DUF5946 family protein [Nocardia crassostreae]|uniref:DUF5946 family protein n=1 Tax=Nocardia crassostreae TaxID=53428 RepID=UPI0012FA8DB5|nr:DUF5946 family protein [Nocardia crassostreae]
MTATAGRCRECGAALPESGDCADRIPELLEIEWRVLDGSEDSLRAPFFAIASFQVQHPSRMTPEATAGLRIQLTRMVRNPIPIANLRIDVRRAFRDVKVNNPQPGDRSAVDPRWPTVWPMTAADIVTRPAGEYIAAVSEWARTTADTIDLAIPREH